MTQLSLTLPIRTVAESNASEHWFVKSKRHRFQQLLIRSAWNEHSPIITLPCTIILTRISPRQLDCDSIPMAMKWIRDELAALIFPDKVVVYRTKKRKLVANKGFADSDPSITWRYAQENGKKLAIRIEVC